jgi:hypothetical protein
MAGLRGRLGGYIFGGHGSWSFAAAGGGISLPMVGARA